MKKRKTIALALGILLVVILVLPLLIPVPDLPHTVPVEQLTDDDSRFIKVNGVDVHYKLTGKGEPTLILLHGFGANLVSWEGVMPELATYGTVIAYDRPGFGLTERPLEWADGENPYSPEAQSDLVIGLMDELNIEQAILVGHSAGGKIAFDTALKYPQRIEALVAVDAAVYNGGGAPSFIKPLLNTPQLNHLGPLIARQLQKQSETFLRSQWDDPTHISEETLNGYGKSWRVDNWDKALWALTVASTSSDLAGRLPEMTLPVLVISGDNDRTIPTEDSIRLADALPNADLKIITASGHLPHEEQPVAFLDAVFQFLEGRH